MLDPRAGGAVWMPQRRLGAAHVGSEFPELSACYGVRHGFASPSRTGLQRQPPLVLLAAALNKPEGFIQAKPLGNGLVVRACSGGRLLLPLVSYHVADVDRTPVMTRSGGGGPRWRPLRCG